MDRTLSWISNPKLKHIPNPIRVPNFLPKFRWSATAMESIVEVVTPMTVNNKRVFNVESNLNLLKSSTQRRYKAKNIVAASNAWPSLLTSALCQC